MSRETRRRDGLKLVMTAVACLGLVVAANVASAVPAVAQGDSDGQSNVEHRFAETVKAFTDSHPAPPAPSQNADDAARSRWSHEMAAYWRAVPWTAVAGQWGCDISHVTVTVQPSALGFDVANLTYVTDDSCAPAEAGSLAVEARGFEHIRSRP